MVDNRGVLFFTLMIITVPKRYKLLRNTEATRLLETTTADASTISPNLTVTYLTQGVRNKTKAIQEVLTREIFLYKDSFTLTHSKFGTDIWRLTV
jgi:hypothetical protein